MVEEYLEQQIQHILALPNDFDGEGSPSYERKTVDKAVECIPKMQELVHAQRKIRIGNPRLRPGPNGSVDLYWKNESYEILLNVPPWNSPTDYFISHNGDEFSRHI